MKGRDQAADRIEAAVQRSVQRFGSAASYQYKNGWTRHSDLSACLPTRQVWAVMLCLDGTSNG